MKLDEDNKSTKWYDAKMVELSVLDKYNIYTNEGKANVIQKGYKKICVEMIYDANLMDIMKFNFFWRAFNGYTM